MGPRRAGRVTESTSIRPASGTGARRFETWNRVALQRRTPASSRLTHRAPQIQYTKASSPWVTVTSKIVSALIEGSNPS